MWSLSWFHNLKTEPCTPHLLLRNNKNRFKPFPLPLFFFFLMAVGDQLWVHYHPLLGLSGAACC